MARRRESVGGSGRTAALDAGQVQALHDEAAQHRVAGRYEAATSLYERIERANPAEVNAPYFLALIDLVRGRPAPALKRLSRLVARLPASLQVWKATAHARRALGQWPEAIDASRRVLTLEPADAAEKTELAAALEVVGAFDEAIGILRELGAEAQTRAPALAQIAKLRPSALGPEEVAEIAAAARSQALDAEQRSLINFALGEILEREGRLDDAFAAFAEGARLKRAMLTGEIAPAERSLFAPAIRAIDPAEAEREDADHVGFMKAVFTRDFLAAHAGGGHPSAAPIFIVGMPRSGSTLIEQILSSHPSVQGLGETTAFEEAIGADFPLKLFAEPRPNHFRRLGEAYLADMRERGWSGSPRFVDKMLHNYMLVGMIHLVFPRAVILHAVRDPVDTCLANFRIPFQTAHETSYDLGEIGRQYVRYREMMAHWDAVLPGRVVEVAHEALVADPEAQIRRLVTEACGLPWREACLRFHETRRPVRTASVAQVRQPIFATSVGRWRRYEKHLGPLFEALGPFAQEAVRSVRPSLLRSPDGVLITGSAGPDAPGPDVRTR